MSRPSWREFRRHRAVEQGCSLPPPAPQASIVLLPVRKLQNWPRNPLAKLREKISLEPRAKTTVIDYYSRYLLICHLTFSYSVTEVMFALKLRERRLSGNEDHWRNDRFW